MATILVVDDESFERVFYEKRLMDEGYNVILAGDGFEAIEKVKNEKPDLVVLDIKMPGIDGIETLGKICQENYDLPIIINTNYEVWRDNFRTRAADAYVIKSPDLKELKEKIKELLMMKGKIT